MATVNLFERNFTDSLQREIDKLITKYAHDLAQELLEEYRAKLSGEMRSIAVMAAAQIFRTEDERKAFEAGREQMKLDYGEDWPTLWPFVYPTYADYAKSREGKS